MESAPSRTAMFAAVSRGLFHLETASPWVLDDVLALVLVGPVWQQLADAGRKKLTALAFGTDQQREPRSATTAAVRLTAAELSTG